MLLSALRSYAPFRLDALGLITILGVSDLDQAFGTLRSNRYFETLPSIAPFVVSGDYISKPLSGLVLYNITDGVVATDISAWFGRWLMAQDLTWNSSTLFVSYKVIRKQPTLCSDHSIHLAVTTVTMSATVVFAAFTKDPWGIANAISMTVSGLIRWSIICQLRAATYRLGPSSASNDDVVKVLCTLPNGKAVTVFTTRSIVINNLLTNPRPLNPRLFLTTKLIGWACFGCQLVCLGMTALINQLIAIVILVGTSLTIVWGVGVDNENLAQSVVLKRQDDYTMPDSRSRTYSRLCLSQDEEEGLIVWNLLPQRRNTSWWHRYTTTYPARRYTRA